MNMTGMGIGMWVFWLVIIIVVVFIIKLLINANSCLHQN